MQIDITSDVAETLEGFASFLERVRIQELARIGDPQQAGTASAGFTCQFVD